MFNLFKTKEKTVETNGTVLLVEEPVALKQAVETISPSKRKEQIKVKEIHDSFDIAADQALAEANKILSRDHDVHEMNLSTKLFMAGFTSSPKVVKMKEVLDEQAQAKYRADTVERYRVAYPQYKFIFKDQVEKICEKYNLVCATVDKYKGEVPEKNILQIADFKVKPEHIYYEPRNFYSRGDAFSGEFGQIPESILETVKQTERKRAANGNHTLINHYHKYPFFICAPEKDMNIDKSVKRKGSMIYDYVPDPIVLHFLPEGYLVVSKWGLEGNDPQLVNETNN